MEVDIKGQVRQALIRANMALHLGDIDAVLKQVRLVERIAGGLPASRKQQALFQEDD